MARTFGRRTTICITTLDRPDYLERTFRYYRDTHFGGVLLIGDGSAETKAEANQAAIRAFAGDLRIDYVHAPELSQPSTMTEMAKRVATDFAVYSGDDDYLVPYALHLCERLLDKNPEYVSAHGKAVALNASGARAIPFSTSPYDLPTPYALSALARVERLLHSYAVGIFCLHRAEAWKQMFRDTHLMCDKTIGGELAPCFLSAALGRGLEIDYLYLVRQIHHERYIPAAAQEWILSDEFAPSSRIMLKQLTDVVLALEQENRWLPLEEHDLKKMVPVRIWGAYMRYLSHGYFDLVAYRRHAAPKPPLTLDSLVDGTSNAASHFQPVLVNITAPPEADPEKSTLLINWGNPYVMDETISPILAELAERFTVVLLLVDYNLSDAVRAKTDAWKQSGLVDDVLVAPIHGGTPDAHLFMGRLIPVLRWYDFDVLLSISAMQPYERYLTDYIVPQKCLRLVLWPHPTNLFIYPELTRAVVRDGRRGKINRAITIRRLKLQPRAFQELLRPSLTAWRLALFIGLGRLISGLRGSHDNEMETCRREALKAHALPPSQTSAPDDEDVHDMLVAEESDLSFIDRMMAWMQSYYLKYNAAVPAISRAVRGLILWVYGHYVNFEFHRKKFRMAADDFLARAIHRRRVMNYKVFLRPVTGMRTIACILAGMDFEVVMRKYLYTCDRYVLPLLQIGKPIPFRRLDSITQIGTDQFDACLFYNDTDTEAHKVFYDHPNFYTVRYVARPAVTEEEPVNAVLLPFTLHDEKDLTPELVEVYRRDLRIALEESGADEVHIRPHPGRKDSTLQDLADKITAGGVPCRLVDCAKPLSEQAACYRGVVGAVSGALRDARLACPDIFVVGSVALSETTFEMPKEVVGFPESIGWIERDGSYDPAIFQPKSQAMAAYPSVPELIDKLMAGEWNRRPERLDA